MKRAIVDEHRVLIRIEEVERLSPGDIEVPDEFDLPIGKFRWNGNSTFARIMRYRAELDHDGVFWSVQEVEDLMPGDVEVPKDCDLRPGAYKWDGAKFMPLPKAKVKLAPRAPTLEEAFHDLLKSWGSPLPAKAAAWAAEFEKSIDMKDGG